MNLPGSPPEALPANVRVIRVFWRRILALVIDALILCAFGFISALFLFNVYAELGSWGRLFGFLAAMAYFGVLNSSFGSGGTLGKRMVGIEVVDRNGEHISVLRSMIRYAILGAPFFLNGALIPARVAQSFTGYAIGFVIFGGAGAITYLYLFNRRTRQSLHDLAAGTFVVRRRPPGPVTAGAIWRPHLAVVGVWFIAVFVFMTLAPRLLKPEFFKDLARVQQEIESRESFLVASVFVGTTRMMTGETRMEWSYFQTNVTCNGHPGDYDRAAIRVASIVLENYPGIADLDFLEVTIAYGYDIGLARQWMRKTIRLSPAEWQEVLRPPEHENSSR